MNKLEFFIYWLKTQRSLLAFHLLFFICFNAILAFSAPLSKSITDVLYMDLLYATFLLTYLICKFLKYHHCYWSLVEALYTNQKNLAFYVPETGDNNAQLMKSVVNAIQLENTINLHTSMNNLQEMEDYATLWVHEMKTPLAILTMNLSALEDEVLRENFQEEIDRIAHLSEQFLYYSRSNDFTKDYLISEVSLNRVGSELLRKHASILIRKRLSVDFNLSEKSVLSDKKWLTYIIEQALVNAIKYTPSGGKIGFLMTESETFTQFTITDSGIGIPTEDLPRVLERGYTGQTGRQFGASTGMGLYLAHKLAHRLGHKIELSSSPNKGTSFTLTFYKFNDHRNLTDL